MPSSLQAKRASCRAKKMVYDTTQKECRARKKRRSGSTVKEKRGACRKDGKVYDTKTKLCRASKRSKKKGGGVVHHSPSPIIADLDD